MKKQVRLMIMATMALVIMFSFNGYGQELFSTIFNEEVSWDNPGGSWTSYNEKTYEEGDWFFHSTESVRGTAAESYGGSAYSFRDRDVFSVHNTEAVSGMSGFSMQLRDWMLGAGEQRNMKISLDGGENWETVAVINKDWFDAYQVYQEYIYYFPGGSQSFAAEEFMIELDGGGNANTGRINIGQFVALGESSAVITPVFNPNGGTFMSPVDVEIQTATPGATIFYSLDSETGPWTVYIEEITVSETTTIWAYATADGLDDSNVAHATFTFPALTEVATLAELRDMPVDDTHYLFTGNAVIVAMDGFRNRKFIQDETAAILIDDDSGVISTDYELYDVITDITGKLDLFHSMLRFQPQANTEPATENIPTDPYIFALDEVTSVDQAKLIQFTSVSFVDIDDGQVFANGTNYVVSDGVNEFVLRTDFWNVDYIGNPIPGYSLDIAGVVIQYQDFLQIVPRFAADMEPAAISNDANLAIFTVGGIDVLELSGLVVDDPDTDPGATLLVEDFSNFFGIFVETQHAQAEAVVTINGIVVAEEDLEDHLIAYEDVILVTVTAEDQITLKYYKLTVLGENRVLTILTPEAGDEFFTYDEIIFSWEAENIEELLFEVYNLETEEVVISEVVPAEQGEIIETVPNGINGTYIYRLTDNDDPGFYEESGIFAITDNEQPGLLDKYPAAGAENIPVSIGLAMTFDEDVTAGAGSIHIYKEQGNQLIESIAADSDQVIFAEDEVLVSLTANFEFETSYYILVDNNAVQDVWGNYFEGIEDPAYWAFTTREDALICNGDFEYWFDDLPDCWYGEKSNISAANVVQYDENPYSGSYAVQLINTGSSHRRFTSQVTSVEDGVDYMITFWVKGKGQIRTGLFDDRETGFGYAPYNDYIDIESDSWAEHSQIVTAANTSDIAEFIFSLRFTDEDFGHLQLDHVTVEEYEPEPPTEVDNLAELRNMPADGTVYHYTGNAVIVAMDDFRNRKFIQDETAAILIDDLPGIIETEYELYDVITGIIGKISISNNMVRFQPEENTAPATENAPVEPYLIGMDEVTADDQAKLIQFENVVFLDLLDDQVFENGFNYTISDGQEEFIVRTDFWDVDYIGELVPQTPMNISGVVLQHQETLQLVPRFMADFEDYEEPGFTVTFIVTDTDGNVIDDAVITFDGIEYDAGVYVFAELEEGEYAWTASRLCYQDETASVFVDENIDLEIVLHLDILPGDANGDGAINVLDIIAIANYYAETPPVNFCPYNADVNGDGFINILDIILTVNIFMDNKMVPYPGMKSEAAHIYLGKDGITLESDGTLAGIQFELSGEHAGLALELKLPGHELVYGSVDGLLKVIIFSLDNKGIPAGTVRLLDFDREASLAWSDVLAGNLNAQKVPVNTFEDEITPVTVNHPPKFRIYPNPASDMIWIEYLSTGEEALLSLFDVNGRMIKKLRVGDQQASQVSMSLVDQKPGVYMLWIEISGEHHIERIIVK